jgi:hypothetical protein
VRPYGCDDKLAQAVMRGMTLALQQANMHVERPLTLHWFDPSTQQLHLNITQQQLIGR